MRKIIALEFLSLDGVLQAPGGPEEDTSGGFKYGGWTAPYMDEFGGEVMSQQMSGPFELLLGKKTYDIWEAYWPHKDDHIGNLFNSAKKYVVSHSDFQPAWDGTFVVTGDVVEQLKKLKKEDGPDLHVYGSGNLAQTLLQNDLLDELWLKIFPVTLGSGKKLFADGTMPAAFKLLDAKVSPSGVIIANYQRDGDVKTGSML